MILNITLCVTINITKTSSCIWYDCELRIDGLMVSVYHPHLVNLCIKKSEFALQSGHMILICFLIPIQGPCQKEDETCQQPCLYQRKDCEHACGAPCHSGKPCPQIPCKSEVCTTQHHMHVVPHVIAENPVPKYRVKLRYVQHNITCMWRSMS